MWRDYIWIHDAKSIKIMKQSSIQPGRLRSHVGFANNLVPWQVHDFHVFWPGADAQKESWSHWCELLVIWWCCCIDKLYIISTGACGPWFINQPGSMLNRCNMIHFGHFSWLDFFHSILKPCRCHAWLHGGSLFDFASQWWSPQMNTNGGLDKVLNIICKVVCRVICGERDFIKYHFVHGLWGQWDSLTR